MVFRPPFVIPRLDRGIQGSLLRPCRMALDPAIKSRGDTVRVERGRRGLRTPNPPHTASPSRALGESRTRPTLTRRR